MEIDVEQLVREFTARYSATPRLFQAPGRVNLIGEHTDYNEGFVMPFAIDRQAVVAGAARDDLKLNVLARDLDESVTIDLDASPVMRRGSWVDYIEGTARTVGERFGGVRGADLILTSTVPIGGGLSSSAAIEVSVGFALLNLHGIEIDPKKLAFAAQRAEHEFVGTRSGIMDQFASVFSREGQAMLLDCRSLDIDYIGIDDDEMTYVVIDTKVKHNLASSEYNTRREECEEGVAILKRKFEHVKSLRDVNQEQLSAVEMPDNILRRCRHVITENQRTLSAADAFRRRDFAAAGKLMSDSHRSLRDDYEVSCAELDLLVETALRVDGVSGSRMTGGGFGGCTVTLVKKDWVDELGSASVKAFVARFGHEPEVYTFKVSNGASELTV